MISRGAIFGVLLELSSSTFAATANDICPNLIVKGDLEPPLLEVEKRLVCGDPQTEAWGRIPLQQAEASLRSFLKDRGYYFPDVQYENGLFTVDLKNPTVVKSIKVLNSPVDLKPEENRMIMGERLTPKLLRQVNKWSYTQLQNKGYPCPRTDSEADPETGELQIEIDSGPALPLVGEEEYKDHDLNPSALHRYDAFNFGDPYNAKKVSLTESRLVKEGLVQSVHLTPSCRPGGAWLNQDALTGPPRTVRLGLGVSTESLIIAKASWKNSRMDKNGSALQFSGYASAIEQSLYGSYSWYLSDEHPRFELKPTAQFTHVLRNAFEYNELESAAGPQWTWDSDQAYYSLFFGPDHQYYQLIKGVGVPFSNFLSLSFVLNTKSHEYEYFYKSPRSGYFGEFSVLANNQAIGSTATADRFRLQGKLLFDPGNYDPPVVVFGVRGLVQTTVTNQTYGLSNALPPSFLSYLGGSSNLRGFNLVELPENGQGGLSEYYIGLESVLDFLAWNFKIKLFPQRIEPLLFLDVGAIGTQSFVVDSPVYYSPGIGIRWASTIGPIRFTLAKGYPSDTPGHLQFYFSLGEEF